jgi:hypothetical protein
LSPMVRLNFANRSQKVLDNGQTEVATILALDHPAVFTSKRPYALDFQSTRATSNASSTNKIYQGANQKISMVAIMILTMAILPLLEIHGERLISQADTSA